MKLYLISQEINNDYDTYDSAVVSATSEEDAKTINPSGYVTHIKDNEWMGTYKKGGEYRTGDDCWVRYNEINKVTVQYLGETELERGVILASFNAG